jgi:hypothetical protein
MADTDEGRALHASTSSSIHLMFDERRLPTLRLQPADHPGGRMSLYFEVASHVFPGHDAIVVLTGHREDLVKLLDQARNVVEHASEPLPPSPAEQAEAERAGR